MQIHDHPQKYMGGSSMLVRTPYKNCSCLIKGCYMTFIIPNPHSLDECHMCGEHIRCGYCGNNTCNGGTGVLLDGKECGCEEAYKVSDAYFKHKMSCWCNGSATGV